MKLTLTYEEAIKALKDYYGTAFTQVPEVEIEMQVTEVTEVTSCFTPHPTPDFEVGDKVKSRFEKIETDQSNDKPWYPDDSGEWVEVPNQCDDFPEGLEERRLIETLLKKERDTKNYIKTITCSEDCYWDFYEDSDSRIVAYKIVE